MAKVCPECGKTFYLALAKTCSEACARKRARKRTKKPSRACVMCATPFKRPGRVDTCSAECTEKFRLANRLPGNPRGRPRNTEKNKKILATWALLVADGSKRSLQETAERFGITRQRVSQIVQGSDAWVARRQAAAARRRQITAHYNLLRRAGHPAPAKETMAKYGISERTLYDMIRKTRSEVQ